MLEAWKAMNAFFVTATGTDIGKTYITAGILRAARQAGRRASAIKPILSGYDPENPANSDSAILLAAMGRPVTAANIAAITPWRFAAPLSPDMAAARENRRINPKTVAAFCQAAIAAGPDLLLIEGAGGAMAPISASSTNCGLITALNLPAILVAGTYLGTISHTITTAEALLARNVTIETIVLSESPNPPTSIEETATTISRFLPGLRIETIPRHYNNTSFHNLAQLLMPAPAGL
jgi:dethiobiotin synthetase